MSIRESAVAGSFYPASCSEIERYIAHFNTVLDENDFKSEAVEIAPSAIIVPHAGYIYSGFTANVAYRSAAQKRAGIKRVVVIGPSHRVYIDGASVALYDRYDSPCGEMKIDLVGDGLRVKYVPDGGAFDRARNLGRDVAAVLADKYPS